MKNITEAIYSHIFESVDNHSIHEICLQLENTKEYTDKAYAIAKSMMKKKPEEISFDYLVNSSTVDELVRTIVRGKHINISSETRTETKKYVAAIIMNIYCDESGKTPEGWDQGQFHYSELTW